MVQDQLVDYVSSQMALGVSRDSIKTALTGAGWVASDVEDTLKKVEASRQGAAPMGGVPGPAKMGEPQTIRVSDLVSGSGSGSSSFGSASPMHGTSPVGVASAPGAAAGGTPAMAAKPMSLSSLTASKINPKSGGLGGQPAAAKPLQSFSANEFPPRKGGKVVMIVAWVLVVAFAGFAGYLYMQNSGLSSQVTTLTSQSQGVSSNMTSLTDQVQGLDASNTALAAENASLTAENADLTNNLAFVVVPAGPSGVTTSTVSITGTIQYIKPVYVLTTSYGVTAYVKNSSDAKVVAALAPFLTAATSTASGTTPEAVTLTGTHEAGSTYITVTAVNGTAVE